MKIKIGWLTLKPTKLTKSDWDTKSRETWCSEISDKILSSFFVTLGPANQRVVVSGLLTIVINLFGFVNHVQRARFFFLACIQFATRFVCFWLAFHFTQVMFCLRRQPRKNHLFRVPKLISHFHEKVIEWSLHFSIRKFTLGANWIWETQLIIFKCWRLWNSLVYKKSEYFEGF